MKKKRYSNPLISNLLNKKGHWQSLTTSISGRCLLALLSVHQFGFSANVSSNSITIEERFKELNAGPGYTINFSNVPALEIVKFLAKIGKLNYIYNEEELNFNVTMTSEGEASLPSVISAFYQVLRVNGFKITDDGENIVLHKNEELAAIAPVIADDTVVGKNLPAIITRVFDVENSNPETVAPIIQKLLSKSGIVSNVPNTRKLIVTDVIGTVEKVSDLLNALDEPKPSLMLKKYSARNGDAAEFEPMLRQLLTPISEGNPVILASQPESNVVFILSTPFLVNEALTFLNEMDNEGIIKNRKVTGDNVFIYQIQYQPYPELKASLNDIAKDLSTTSNRKPELFQTIKSMRYLEASNSIVFTGTKTSLAEVKNLLANLDTEVSKTYLSMGKSDFYIYKIKNSTEEQMDGSVENLIDNLKKAPRPDTRLIQTLESMRYIAETHSLVFTGPQNSLDRVKEILPTFDVKPEESKKPLKAMPSSNDFFVYKPKTHDAEALLDSLEELGDSLKKSGLADPELIKTLENAKYVEKSNSIVFTGTEASIARIKEMLPTIDIPHTTAPSASEYYVYKPEMRNGDKLLDELRELARNFKGAKLNNQQLIATLNNARYVSSTNSLIFTGTEQSINEIKSLLPTIDHKAPSESNVFIYKIQNSTKANIEDALEKIGNGLPENDPLKQVISTVHYLPSSNSLVFKGQETAISRLKELLTVIDDKKPSRDYSYALIKLQNAPASAVMRDIRKMSDNLKESGLSSEGLIQTLDSAHYVESTNSIYVSGPKATVEEAKTIIEGFDVVKKKSGPEEKFFIYKIENSTGSKMLEDIHEMVRHMKGSGVDDKQLIEALESAQYVRSSHSIYISGTQSALDQIKPILENFDVHDLGKNAGMTYSIYKLKNANGETVMEDLKKMRSNISSSGIDNKSLLQSLESARYISSTNSIYFTGTKTTIEEMSNIIESFDVSSKVLPKNSSFYMYKPVHGTPQSVRSSLISIAEELRSSGLADKSLIETIRNVRVVEKTGSLLFTGTKENIDEIKSLITEVDYPLHDVKTVGKTTFVVYKIKFAPAKQLIAHLKSVAADLSGTDASDQQLVKTLDGLRYIQETNSLVFTGTKDSLEKTLQLVAKFDTKDQAPTRAATVPENYIIYKPKYLSGEELVQILHDFEHNLVSSGIKDDELFETINNIKWMPRTSSILVSGPDDATKKVEGLLKRFDVPGEGSQTKQNIETINDLSFLIYKLQFHQGNEIESALRSIAQDLTKAPNSDKNKPLIDAINSIQWIQVTNSLLGTGDASTLSRLKDLLKNIDVPLRQVFIEVLVVETQVTDTTQFGLRYGSQGVYKERLAYGTGALPAVTGSAGDPFGDFNTALQNITAKTTPTGKDVPFASGSSDLGVIGDIILHKGKSYFALGSLINALQTDGESTVVLNQKLITQDNQQSNIFVGNNVPYAGSVVTTTQGAGTQTNTNLEYRDIGVNLTITPTVGDGNMLTLNIDQEISEEEEDDQGSTIQTGTVNGIRTSKTTTSTKITMPSDNFLAISGMIRNTTEYTKTGIPCLGGLPVLGLAFSQNDRKKVAQNVIVFIRPHIINTFEEYKQITERQEDLYRAQTSVEPFDEAVELVKTPDDE